MRHRNKILNSDYILRAIVFSITVIGLIFFRKDCIAFAQDSKEASQKAPTQSKSDSAANEGAILTSDQGAKPELMLKRDKWQPVIWFVSGAAVALVIMYYAVRIFNRPIAKK